MKFEPNLEALYQTDLGAEQIRAVRFVTLVGSVLYFSFGILDYWAIPSVYLQVWAIRAVVMLFLLLVYSLSRWRRPFVLSNYSGLMVALFLAMGSGIVSMIALAHRSDMAWSSYYCGLMLVCSGFALSYLSVSSLIFIAVTLVASYLCVAVGIQGLSKEPTWPLLLMNCYFLGSTTLAGVIIAAVRDRHTRELFLLRHALHRDIELTNEAKRQSDYLANHDMLTEMPNRIRFMRLLEAAIGQAREQHKTIAVLFLDLNGFKPVNDRYGHEVGDKVLKIVSQRIRSCVNANDLIARMGGDEFVIAVELDYFNILSAVKRLQHELEQAITSPMGIEGGTLSVEASIGTSRYPFDADEADKLIRCADRRMYEAKRQSKDRWNESVAVIDSADPNSIGIGRGTYLCSVESPIGRSALLQ
jgi:diguanylate cyclase (GGDEF)-like protein